MAIWRNGPGYLVQLLVRWLAFAASARLRLIWPMWRQAAMKVSGKVISSLGTWRRVCCRSEEHTSELQSLMRISSAVFCLKKKTKNKRSIYLITRINFYSANLAHQYSIHDGK